MATTNPHSELASPSYLPCTAHHIKTRILIVVFLTSITTLGTAQNFEAVSDSILQEGLQLFHIEKFAWLTSDLVQKDLKKTNVKLNNYVAFAHGDSMKTIFYYKDKDNTTIKYTGNWIKQHRKKNMSHLDTINRCPTPKEKIIINIKSELSKLVVTPPSFQKFRDSGIRHNISIIERGNIFYAYLLPTSNKNTYFGGDFICSYTLDGELIKVVPQHKGLIRINYPTEETPAAHFHNHLDDMSPFITATDICQAKLYGKQSTGISNYIVISDLYKSEFNVDTEELEITKR